MRPVEALRIDGVDHLSAEQVARRLGVKVQTVYAYASRGVLRRRRLPGRRESYFPLAEVEALTSGGGTRRRPPGLSEDVRTALTLVEHDRLSYRGHDVVRLARESTFAEVVALLWGLEPRFETDAETVAAVRRALAPLPGTATLADRVRVLLSVLAADSPDRHDLDPAVVTAAVGRVMATSVACLLSGRPPWPVPGGTPHTPPRDRTHAATRVPPHEGVCRPSLDPPDGGLPAALAAALGVTDTRWVEQACILLADHDMAGSTTAARVAASVRTDPFGALTAALAAFDSPLHGTAGRRVHALLGELLDDPAGTLAHCLHAETVPGFGHVVYETLDPRAELLVEHLARTVDHPLLAATERLSDRLWQRRGLPRTVDLALALGAHLLGGDADLPETVFLHARMAGWTAHVLEEYAEPALRFRLRGVYTGARPT
ncbi:helix-turn-helix domain-containing protein [Desertihabitans brevis]|uniref:citrate synthase (unknown stereospecificity) n=1 Tax=Desertihabitans brevis TaxID=2268447 RepID=A0A367YVQ0_9ACTN|nr:citrate/2-methylcitrate synthase [Desertihabitans brevis]RCK69888.1 helix-turn-helix domain-containing protein [Desertihabitans brevis]